MVRDQAIRRALGARLSLGVLCATMSAAALLQSAALLLFGMAAFLGLVARDLHMISRRSLVPPPRLPDGSAFGNLAIRTVIDGIRAAQRERQEALDACPDDVLCMLDDVLKTAVALETAALRLARRTDRLHGYLMKKDMMCARETLRAAEQSAQMSRSPEERQNYDVAVRTYAAGLETLGALDVGIRVALSELENIRAMLVVVPPRIVKLSAASADLADAQYVHLSDELRAASFELHEVEERFLLLARGGDEALRLLDAPAPSAGT